MERSRFFDSVGGDRAYTADDWSSYFALLVGDGIFPVPGDALQVVANGTMGVRVGAGAAFVKGRSYELTDGGMDLAFEGASATLKRAARVVLRYSAADREIRLAVKYSAFAASPEPPALQRDDGVWELCLADVAIGKSQQFVRQADITDRRWDSSYCGAAAGLVEQLDTSSTAAQIQDWYDRTAADMAAMKDDTAAWADEVKGTLGDDPAASLAAAVVELDARADEMDARFEKDTVTLAAASWTADKTYTIADARILAPEDMDVRIFPSPASTVYDNACVFGLSQSVGSVVLKAYGVAPASDVPCQIEFVKK